VNCSPQIRQPLYVLEPDTIMANPSFVASIMNGHGPASISFYLVVIGGLFYGLSQASPDAVLWLSVGLFTWLQIEINKLKSRIED